ncbi:Lin-54 family [Phytophthora cactorum]|nr:Lin-54 family [Phytophthora cactorum]
MIFLRPSSNIYPRFRGKWKFEFVRRAKACAWISFRALPYSQDQDRRSPPLAGSRPDPLEAKKARDRPRPNTDLYGGNKAAEAVITGTNVQRRQQLTRQRANTLRGPVGGAGERELGLDGHDVGLAGEALGSDSSLPVCLTDLESANMFNLPQSKKLKTGIASNQAATNSTNSQQIPARLDHEQEQAKEKKRQQLLLRHAQQIQASSVSSSTSCGCKTGCLKMYCMCFSSRGFCHAGCGCDDCKNGRQNQTERVEAIQNYLANDPRAFSFASLPQDTNTTGFLHLLPQKSSAVVMRGCRCKKSKCLKKYCECFQNGIACTSHCRCMDCSNHSESTAPHQHPNLQKRSATGHGKRAQSGSSIPPTAEKKPFHPVHITVTKQPRRNHVGKTLRLNL